jgi:hypothetical protein
VRANALRSVEFLLNGDGHHLLDARIGVEPKIERHGATRRHVERQLSVNLNQAGQGLWLLLTAAQIGLHAVGGPCCNPASEEIRVLGPDGTAKRQRGCQNRPVLWIAST